MTDRPVQGPEEPAAVQRAVNGATHVIEEANAAMRFIRWACIAIVVLLAGGTILLNRIDSNTDRNSSAVEHVEDSVDDLERSVEEIRVVALAVGETTPDEAARNQAITNAVTQVPEIKSILCESFPEATACREP